MCCNVSIPTKIRTKQAMIFPMTLYGSEIWNMLKQDKKRAFKFEDGEDSENNMDTQEWIIKEINLEFSFRA